MENYTITADIQLSHYYRVHHVQLLKFNSWDIARELLQDMEPKILKINLKRYSNMKTETVTEARHDNDEDTTYAMSNFIRAADQLKQSTNSYYLLGLLIELQKELVKQGNRWTPTY